MRTFSAATRTATRSMSMASTSFAPMWAAAMARMPVPVPTSMAVLPGCTYFSTSSTHMPVVSWVPVPKAMPGSISITLSPGSTAQSHQPGLMSMCLPSRRGLKDFFQFSAQSSSAKVCWRISSLPASKPRSRPFTRRISPSIMRTRSLSAASTS